MRVNAKTKTYKRTDLTLDQRLGLDLLEKCFGTAFGLVLYAGLNLRVAYQMPETPQFLHVLLWTGIVVYLVRVFSLKHATKKPFYPKNDIRFLRYTIVPLLTLAVVPASYLIYLTHFDDLRCLFFVAEIILIFVTSSYTLASHGSISRAVHMIAALGLVVPSAIVWYETRRTDVATLIVAFGFIYIYLTVYSRQVVTEIKEKFKYEIALEKTNKVLEESRASLLEETAKADHASRLASLGEMAGGIAHEINNPLTIISLLSRKLEKAALKENIPRDEILEIKSNIDETTNRISKIVRALRSFSRNGETDPFESISIESLCTQVKDLISARLYNDNIQFSQDHENAALEFECRSVQVSQVLFNLVNNSADAVQGSEKPWIRVQSLTHPDKIIFRVSDSGKGIDPRIAEKMFNPFFTTKEQGKGTGLGLSISLGLVKKHGGRLYLDGKASNTTFIVEIPRVQSVELKKAG